MFLRPSVSSSVPRKGATVVQLLVDGEDNLGLHCTLHHLEVTRRLCRLMLDKEAGVNAQGGMYGNALQAGC